MADILAIIRDAKTLTDSQKIAVIEQVYTSLDNESKKKVAKDMALRKAGGKQYRLTKDDSSMEFYSMKGVMEFLKANGVEKPHETNIYRCLRGKAKSIYGYEIEKIN